MEKKLWRKYIFLLDTYFKFKKNITTCNLNKNDNAKFKFLLYIHIN